MSNARQHINTERVHRRWAVYGGTDTRLDWLREGSLDGNPDNNNARLLMPNNYLPARTAGATRRARPPWRSTAGCWPTRTSAVVAGDVRANERVGLTSVQTLFAREHNRIVSRCPATISQQDKFQLARAVVIAEQQYITYNEFLPAMGVSLPSYQGYDDFLDPSLSHEFASVGYRAHSQIHGEVEVETNVSRYIAATLAALEAQGVEVDDRRRRRRPGRTAERGVLQPRLVKQIQLGPLLQGFGGEPEYKNDEMIDNSLRSVLFRVPTSTNPECLDGPTLPECFSGVVDLGAIDMQRGRDHGMPTYNQMRNAYGLSSKTSFTPSPARRPSPSRPTRCSPRATRSTIPTAWTSSQLFDINGNPTTARATTPTRVVKRTTVAARLKAIYGSVSNLDAFTGMLAEKHVTGSELGELQLAIWKDQFGAARDGDRFFYLNDPLQTFIRQNFGIDSRKTLAQVIAANTDIPLGDLQANVFRTPAGLAAASAIAGASVAPGTMATTPSDLTRHSGAGAGKAATTTDRVAVVPGTSTPRSLQHRRRRRLPPDH